MTDDEGWFRGVDPGEVTDAREAIETGGADSPADWPALAVGTGFAADEEEYYDLLHEATVSAARDAARERERADDRQLVHAVRAIDDRARMLL